MILYDVGDRRSLAFRGAAALVFGLVTLVWPGLTLTALLLLFGAYALVDGVSALVAAFTRGSHDGTSKAIVILLGLSGVAAGVITFVWPDITALALLFVIAAWALVTGVFEIVAAVRLRRELRGEWLLALAGVLWVLFAGLLVITPGAGALVITWLIGWFALFEGIVLLALVWRLRQLDPRTSSRRFARPATP
jgi:uncharacterized membrane protein HdeD (DUF308 family)